VIVESSLENRNVGAVLLAMRLILALGVALLARCAKLFHATSLRLSLSFDFPFFSQMLSIPRSCDERIATTGTLMVRELSCSAYVSGPSVWSLFRASGHYATDTIPMRITQSLGMFARRRKE
jgi:hypothetical protein